MLKKYEELLNIYDDCDWEDITTEHALQLQDYLFSGVRRQFTVNELQKLLLLSKID